MFKGTKKMWKGIALLLALAMIPTGVFAEGEITGNTGTSVEITSATYAEETNTVTVTGTISDANADVTILALRQANVVTEEALANYVDATLLAEVVYIDQEQFEGGNFTFEFIPRSGIKGKTISIFVGGENVQTLDTDKIENVATTAPDVKPAKETWYEGEPLKLNIVKAGTESDVYGDAAAVEGWFNSINSFKVNGTEATKDLLGNDIIVSGVTGPVTIIEISTTDDEYKEEKWEGNVEQEPKPAGEFSNAPTKLVAGEATEIVVANANEKFGAAWETALETGTTDDVTVAVTLGDATVDYSYDAATDTLALTADFAEPKNAVSDITGDLVISITNYEDTELKSVKVVAPTVEEAASVQAAAPTAAAYTKDETPDAANGGYAVEIPADETEDDPEKLATMYGHAIVTLPVVDSAFDVDWTITTTAEGVTAPVVEDGATEVELPRPGLDADDSIKSYTYTFTTDVVDNVYVNGAVSFDITVSRMGVSGVNVSVKIAGGAAKDAVVKLMNDTSEVATLTITETWTADAVGAAATEWTFAADGVIAGTYDLVISRPGYLTRTIEDVVVGNENAAFGTKTLLFGDNRGMMSDDADGVIDLSDYDAIVSAVLVSTDLKYDANGDGVVDLGDYDALVSNVLKTYATIED